MSERGSFVTEFIYCPQCFEVCQEVLLGNSKSHTSVEIRSWEPGKTLPIIAGKLGGGYSGEEIVRMEQDLKPLLDEKLCHPVRVAVLAENGESRIFLCGINGETGQNETESRDMSKTTFEVPEVEELESTITITLKLREWRILKDAIRQCMVSFPGDEAEGRSPQVGMLREYLYRPLVSFLDAADKKLLPGADPSESVPLVGRS